ncbi:MAG: response regulator [Pseudomonadota bacterium]
MVSQVHVKKILAAAVVELRRQRGETAPEFYWHYDPTLPERLAVDENSLTQLVEALLGWAAVAGTEGIAGVAMWRGHEDFGDAVEDLVIETSRFRGRDAAPLVLGSDATAAQEKIEGWSAWPDLLGPDVTDGPGAERRLFRLRGAVPVAAEPGPRWGHAFERRRLLVLRDPVMSKARMQRSLGASSLVTEFEPDPEAAVRAVTERVRAGLAYDFAVLNAPILGDRVGSVVDALRAAAVGTDLRIVLCGADERHDTLPGIDRRMLKEFPERLMDVLFEIVRRPPAAAGSVAGSIVGAAVGPTAGMTAAEENMAGMGSRGEVPSLVGKHILIVEDVAMNRALLQAMLAPTGASLAVAVDGKEAIEAVVARPADLVLMDIQLPVMDGLEATRRIRAAGRRLPIIALTANARETDRATYLAAGMDGYLAKPIRVDDLYSVLRSVLFAKAS